MKHSKSKNSGYGRCVNFSKKILSFLLISMLLVSSALCAVSADDTATDGEPYLKNLIIDKVYELTPETDYPEGVEPNDTGCAPEVTSYTGTAYSSVDSIQIYPFASSDSAVVTVNDQTLNNSGYVAMSVTELGEHNITVKVSEGDMSKTYTVKVTKVNSDYRGRTAIVNNETIMNSLSVETAVGDKEKLMEILK